MKVLFVDDEAMVLGGIENALFFDGDDIEATFAASGEAALLALDHTEFDVLVTDMTMPGLTGADVLEFARDRQPTVARVVLSGEVDVALAQRAMPLTHEFVSKPCDPARLFDIVRGVYETARSLDSPIIAELVGSMSSLPAQPRIFGEIQSSIEDNAGLAALAAIVETDIGISSAVLRTANSAFYGFRSPAHSLHEAISRLGSTSVSGIALSAELSSDAPTAVINELRTLNTLAANVARIVRQMIGAECPQAALAALLRSIGVVVLQTHLTDVYRPVQEHFNRTGEADEAAEIRLFGATHAEIGAYVLRMWKVDPIVVDAVHHHRNVGSASSPEARRIIHAMAAADAALGPNRDIPEWIDSTLVERARAINEGSS